MKTLLSFLLILSNVLVTVDAGDWPSWRGPARDDISKEKGLLKPRTALYQAVELGKLAS